MSTASLSCSSAVAALHVGYENHRCLQTNSLRDSTCPSRSYYAVEGEGGWGGRSHEIITEESSWILTDNSHSTGRDIYVGSISLGFWLSSEHGPCLFLAKKGSIALPLGCWSHESSECK
eukprot:scaffold95944_cov33-Tisochrysis_lutea.AAC.5